MLASFDISNLHAIFVSETWLKPCLLSTSYSLPGFVLIRNDRIGRVGGGVAIYLRSHIPYSVVSMSPQPPPTTAGEHLLVEVTLLHTKVLLGVYYCPSSSINFFSTFEQLLIDFSPSCNHTIILGDFNTCLLKHDYRTTKFETLVKASNLTILPLNATHHFPDCVPSLLDLILVSSPNNVSMHGQYPADAFSYHDLLFLSYKIRPPKLKPQIVLQRNFGGINLEYLRKDAADLDWSEVAEATTVDEKLSLFNTALIKLYDKHAPFKTMKIKHLPAPWLTPEIKIIMHKKNSAKFRYKCRPSDENYCKYLKQRNLCNKVCRDAQRRFIHKSVYNDDPSKVWKFLRTLGVGRSRHNSIPNNVNLDLLNKHFSSSSNINNITKSTTIQQLISTSTPDFSPFIFSEFSDCDVERGVKSIASNAVGNENISRNMLVPILNEIIPVLSHILNFSASTSTFPDVWKNAQIIPLPKKSNPSTFYDYRPISILPFLSKVLERLVHTQLSTFLNINSLVNPLQSGFRRGHSTTSALTKITDDIRLGMDNGHVTVLTLLDFSNAFNNVDFDILLGVLRSLNVSSTALDWFHSYLFGRRQRVRVDDTFSSWCDLTAGVPQGGVLSPLLFAIFINSISQTLTSSYHLYADDLQIYTQASINDLSGAIADINSDLMRILAWSKSFGLSMNPKKTQAIIIGSSRMISKINWSGLPQVVFDDIPISFNDSVKNLGVIMDKNMSWDPHLAELSRKMFASAASLRRLGNFLPTSTKVMLAQSLLLLILDYADACYPDLTEAQLDKLERLQNFSIRFIFGLRKYDHVSDFRNKLKWLPMRSRRNTHILSLLYTILFNPATPPYLKDRFEYLDLSNSRTLRSSSTLQLKTPPHSSTFYEHSFTVQAVRLWNALPVDIRKAKSLPIFKKLLYSHYLL